MKLTSAIARQKAMNPNVQSGLQFRGSMGDRSTGIVGGPPPTPRAEPTGPRAPAETSPASASPRYQPQAQVQSTYQVNPNASWKPQTGTAASTPPPGPRAPYSVTPSGPGAPPPVHRQQTDQGNLTGSMGWRSTYYGPSLAERVAGMQHGAAPGQGMPAGTGTMNPDYTRNNNYWNLNVQQQQAGGSGAVFSTQPQTQQQAQQSPTQGGTGGGGGDFGTSRSALTADPGPPDDGAPDYATSTQAARRVVRSPSDNPAEVESSVEKMRQGQPLSEQDLENIHQWLREHSSSTGEQEFGIVDGKIVRFYTADSGLRTYEVIGDPSDPSTWPEDFSRVTGAQQDRGGEHWNQTGFNDDSLARTLGVTNEVLNQMGADGYTFITRTDENGNKTTYVRGPDGSLEMADGSSIIRGYQSGAEQASIKDLLDQGPPGFDQQALDERVLATRRVANMQNAESVAAAMQMAANAGSSPDAMASLVADAGQRQSVQLAAMEAEQRFQAEVQQKQAELSWVQSRLQVLQQQAAFSQDMAVRQQALEAAKELQAYQAQIQMEMAAAQESASQAAQIGSAIGMIGGALIGGLTTGGAGVAAGGAAGAALGGYLGGRFG